MTWETAELEGGPADGTRIRVTGRPKVLQVTVDCPVEEGAPEVSVAAVSVYRRKAGPLPLRYGWDGASP
ncbi:hypothetical protein OG896_21780 [Streptomyces sp. NBC_00669]|uniref:hypothetical protein n=1 Tax=unclassified Streptomyces TaxID=2593676 RepID=UPI002E30C6B2|nr:hypothetical protein [Streptomyces sp. NBC_00669]